MSVSGFEGEAKQRLEEVRGPGNEFEKDFTAGRGLQTASDKSVGTVSRSALYSASNLSSPFSKVPPDD